MLPVRGEVMLLEILLFHMHKVLHIYRQQGEGKTLDHMVWIGGGGGGGIPGRGGAPGSPREGAACLQCGLQCSCAQVSPTLYTYFF
jgi:hypothetical protein